jgi:hypothetical protein
MNTLYVATAEMLEAITGKKRTMVSEEPRANADLLVQ